MRDGSGVVAASLDPLRLCGGGRAHLSEVLDDVPRVELLEGKYRSNPRPSRGFAPAFSFRVLRLLDASRVMPIVCMFTAVDLY
jgi:hypothetical protein